MSAMRDMGDPTRNRHSRKVMVGGDADGNRLFVTVSLETEDRGYSVQTVDHEEVHKTTRLSMIGELWPEYGRDAIVSGQCYEELLNVSIAVGFNHAALQDMHDTWKRWHLNDMQAGCSHQTVVWERHPKYGYRQPSLDRTARCPKTGYKYGSAWLYDPLPADVLAKAQRFIDTGSWTQTA